MTTMLRLFLICSVLFTLTTCDKISFRRIKKVTIIGEPGSRINQLRNPADLRVDEGYLYVCEPENNRIQRFNVSTYESKEWLGIDNGNFGWHNTQTRPDDHFDPKLIYIVRDTIYALDYDDIYKISKSNGLLLSVLDFSATTSLISDFAVDSKGNIYIVNDYDVLVYDFKGTYKYMFGGYGTGDGQFEGNDNQLYIEFDSEDNLYVVCENLVKLKSDGTFIKNIIKKRGYANSSLSIIGKRLYHDMGKFVEYTTDGEVLKRWGDRNDIYPPYCVSDDKIFSVTGDLINVWQFRPEE